MDTEQLIKDIRIRTSRSGGPGGQHANKTESRVEARLDLAATTGLTEAERARVRAFFAERLTENNELIVVRDTHRSQHRNRALAVEDLIALLKEALRPRTRRKKPRPRIDKEARLKAKKARAEKKRWRRKMPPHTLD